MSERAGKKLSHTHAQLLRGRLKAGRDADADVAVNVYQLFAFLLYNSSCPRLSLSDMYTCMYMYVYACVYVLMRHTAVAYLLGYTDDAHLCAQQLQSPQEDAAAAAAAAALLVF